MHHTDPSRTQALSLQLVEKIFQLYEQNEKLIHFRNGEPNFYSRPNQRRFFLFVLPYELIFTFILEVQQGQQRNQGTGGGGSGPTWSKLYKSSYLCYYLTVCFIGRPQRSGQNRAY